jgi:hypothetical protein
MSYWPLCSFIAEESLLLYRKSQYIPTIQSEIISRLHFFEIFFISKEKNFTIKAVYLEVFCIFIVYFVFCMMNCF